MPTGVDRVRSRRNTQNASSNAPKARSRPSSGAERTPAAAVATRPTTMPVMKMMSSYDLPASAFSSSRANLRRAGVNEHSFMHRHSLRRS